ncbi:MAG: alpha-methylacyl-CoA racemase [Mycobacterium sp.]|nr:alpha-methylacyl-CoA racemase [Mycobacterium sp.]MDT5174870.1 alpha-methylacyl-CoA racemase [Mycobacterium sp.]
MTQAAAVSGTRVIELAGMGPGPHAAMVLADLGADVVRVQPADQLGDRGNPQLRGRRVVEANLKDPTDFLNTDACVTPVLSLAEAATDAHLTERGVFIEIDGVTQPAPAPRFSRTPQLIPSGPPRHAEVMADLWLD